MRRGLKRLIEHECTHEGNHRVREEGGLEKFTYFQTDIFIVNHEKKTFVTDNGGWDTPSTNRAISEYRFYFAQKGYTEEVK